MEVIDIAKKAIKSLDSKKAIEIQLIKVDNLTSITDYFVIAGATSNTQVRALADEVEFQLKECGVTPYHTEGYRESSWVALDYGSVIVHIFQKGTRELYKLEHLWADGEKTDISDIISED